METLPPEVIELIAIDNHQTWLILVQVFKFLSHKITQEELKKKFLQRRENYKRYIHKIIYCLPDGTLHNYEEPCIDGIDGISGKYWYYNGKLHRDNDQPAVMYNNGTQHWYQHGKQHRDNDQPASINNTGKWWYQRDKLIKYVLN